MVHLPPWWAQRQESGLALVANDNFGDAEGAQPTRDAGGDVVSFRGARRRAGQGLLGSLSVAGGARRRALEPKDLTMAQEEQPLVNVGGSGSSSSKTKFKRR